MSNCPICGTRTGQHGFSWDKDKWPQPKKQFGVLRVPSSVDQEKFLKRIDEIYGATAPEIEFFDETES